MEANQQFRDEQKAPNGMMREELLLDISNTISKTHLKMLNFKAKVEAYYNQRIDDLDDLCDRLNNSFGKNAEGKKELLLVECEVVVAQVEKIKNAELNFGNLEYFINDFGNHAHKNLFLMHCALTQEKLTMNCRRLIKWVDVDSAWGEESQNVIAEKGIEISLSNFTGISDFYEQFCIFEKKISDCSKRKFQQKLSTKGYYPTIKNLLKIKEVLGDYFSEEQKEELAIVSSKKWRRTYRKVHTPRQLFNSISEAKEEHFDVFSEIHLLEIAKACWRMEISAHSFFDLKEYLDSPDTYYRLLKMACELEVFKSHGELIFLEGRTGARSEAGCAATAIIEQQLAKAIVRKSSRLASLSEFYEFIDSQPNNDVLVPICDSLFVFYKKENIKRRAILRSLKGIASGNSEVACVMNIFIARLISEKDFSSFQNLLHIFYLANNHHDFYDLASEELLNLIEQDSKLQECAKLYDLVKLRDNVQEFQNSDFIQALIFQKVKLVSENSSIGDIVTAYNFLSEEKKQRFEKVIVAAYLQRHREKLSTVENDYGLSCYIKEEDHGGFQSVAMAQAVIERIVEFDCCSVEDLYKLFRYTCEYSTNNSLIDWAIKLGFIYQIEDLVAAKGCIRGAEYNTDSTRRTLNEKIAPLLNFSKKASLKELFLIWEFLDKDTSHDFTFILHQRAESITTESQIEDIIYASKLLGRETPSMLAEKVIKYETERIEAELETKLCDIDDFIRFIGSESLELDKRGRAQMIAKATLNALVNLLFKVSHSNSDLKRIFYESDRKDSVNYLYLQYVQKCKKISCKTLFHILDGGYLFGSSDYGTEAKEAINNSFECSLLQINLKELASLSDRSLQHAFKCGNIKGAAQNQIYEHFTCLLAKNGFSIEMFFKGLRSHIQDDDISWICIQTYLKNYSVSLRDTLWLFFMLHEKELIKDKHYIGEIIEGKIFECLAMTDSELSQILFYLDELPSEWIPSSIWNTWAESFGRLKNLDFSSLLNFYHNENYTELRNGVLKFWLKKEENTLTENEKEELTGIISGCNSCSLKELIKEK